MTRHRSRHRLKRRSPKRSPRRFSRRSPKYRSGAEKLPELEFDERTEMLATALGEEASKDTPGKPTRTMQLYSKPKMVPGAFHKLDKQTNVKIFKEDYEKMKRLQNMYVLAFENLYTTFIKKPNKYVRFERQKQNLILDETDVFDLVQKYELDWFIADVFATAVMQRYVQHNDEVIKEDWFVIRSEGDEESNISLREKNVNAFVKCAIREDLELVRQFINNLTPYKGELKTFHPNIQFQLLDLPFQYLVLNRVRALIDLLDHKDTLNALFETLREYVSIRT